MKNKWYGEGIKLGVLGGGQLGRMLIQSAISYDVRIYAMDSSKDAPCGHLAYEFTEGNITNYDDVMKFGSDKDVLTVEIENVNVDALEELEKNGKKVFPQPHILRLIQDKGLQKQFYQTHQIPTSPFHLLNRRDEMRQHLSELPFVQKLRKGGYDGKGVCMINREEDIIAGFNAPSIIEKKIPFKKELSVIVARNENGETKAFPVVECEFSKELNLVEFLFSPASISDEIEKNAIALAKKVINELGLVGLLAVEMFLTQNDELLVNEVAPRTHNSGHHTIESNLISQFEQHFRSILNLPLGSTDMVKAGVMVNLIGEQGHSGMARYEGMEKILGMSGVYVHLYGKQETRPGRKMGHVTITDDDIDKAKAKAREVQKLIKVKAF